MVFIPQSLLCLFNTRWSVVRGTPNSRLVQRVDFLGLAATFAKMNSLTSADVLGHPDWGASATFPVVLNFISSLLTVRCAIGCSQECLWLNSAATSLWVYSCYSQKRIISTRFSVVNIIYLQQEKLIHSHIPLWCRSFGPSCEDYWKEVLLHLLLQQKFTKKDQFISYQ